VNSRLPPALAIGGLVAALTLAPLFTLLIGSFRPDGLPSSPGWTFEHYLEVWGTARIWRLLANSLVFAGASTLVAIVLGGALSWLIERTDLPARNVFRAMILMPMATPPLLLAIGWALVLAPKIGILSIALSPILGPVDRFFEIYSLPGAIFVQSLAYVPTAVLMLSPAIRALDPALEEAALAAGASRWQILRRIGLPILRPALLSTATILIIVGVLAFDVPAVIGIPGHVDLLSIEIFRMMTPPSGFPEYGPAAATNTILLALLAIGLVLYRHTIRQAARFATITGKGYKPAEIRLGRWRGAAGFFFALYFVFAVALPFVALLWASVIPYFAGFSLAMLQRASFKAYTDLLASPRLHEALVNAAAIAVAASAALVVIALAVAWIVLRSKLRRAWLLDVVAMIPLGVPPLMTGIALVFVAFSIKFLPLYGTIWVIVLGHVIAFLPISSRMMQSGLLQITGELEEAAHVAGASVARTVWRILLPLLVPTIMAMVVWVLVHSVREFSIAVMLQSGRNGVLSTMLFNFWETGSPERAAALAVMLMLMLLGLTAFFSLLAPKQREF
jgi:iron(III) transport system permease protein